MNRPEQDLQKSMVKWLQLNLYARTSMFWHTPNGVSHGSKKTRILIGKQQKAMGVLPGFPDLCLADTSTACEACGTSFPIGLEVKVKGNYQEPAQKAVQERFEQMGWPYHVVRSVMDVMDVLDEYSVPYREVRMPL